MTEDQELKKSAQIIQNILTSHNIKSKVIELPNSARTAIDAANAIGCDVNQICKSLIFKTKNTHKPVLVLTSGSNRVKEKIIENYVKEPIVKADANFTREVTGFAIGGIPPIGHKQTIDFIFIDEDLIKFDEIWAAAGTPNAVFKIDGQSLLAITKGMSLKL